MKISFPKISSRRHVALCALGLSAALGTNPAMAQDVDFGTMLNASNEQPLSMSVSLTPASSAPGLSSKLDHPSFIPASAKNSGLMVNTSLQSNSLMGGLSYFSGNGAQSSLVGNFSQVYSFDGWSNFDNILVVPNGQDPATGISDFRDSKRDDLQALSLYGGYALTPSLKIKGAFLISKSHPPTESAQYETKSNGAYSWWLDFGGDYRLNEKMTYSINFGYSDSSKTKDPAPPGDSVQGSVYLFNNQLNMSF